MTKARFASIPSRAIWSKRSNSTGRAGSGTVKWDLVSRNGQDVTSGVYIFSVETDHNTAYKRKIGKFVVIR